MQKDCTPVCYHCASNQRKQHMIWLILGFIGFLALLGFVYGLGRGEKGAAEEGALAGAGIGCGIVLELLKIAVPILIVVLLIRACS